MSKRLTKAKTAVTGLEHAQSQTSRHAIEVTQARQQLDIANTQFTRFLDSLPARFNKPIQDGEAKLAARKAKEFQEALTGLDHTLAIYLVPTEDALQLILVAPKQITTRTIKITQADLEKKLATFRAVLQNPKLDPRPLGKELYDILLKPIEAELTGIKTILWSLDGALRYIPVEALSPDGKGYLVERFAHARLTLTAKQRLTEKTKPTTTALVAGASLGKGGVSPLPGVPSEVNAIASILPGQTLLDPTFTKASFLASLKKGYPLVHIATHFELGEQASQSALLLGDGTRLSLLELLEGGNAFVGVEQVTLSACSTAVGEGSGREVDSLAKVAELLGARSVLASLWPVNDSSTSVLMQRFYTLLKSEPGLGRGECLRKAQRELLSGKASSVGAARGPVAATGGKPPATVPAFIPYPDAPCAHPYYWAPFILIGNTR
nr:CHAT domain-containing protein [Armatimonas sp.]